MNEIVIRYVPHSRVAAYLALGWIAHWDCFTGTHHGAYAVLMEWPVILGTAVEPSGEERQ